MNKVAMYTKLAARLSVELVVGTGHTLIAATANGLYSAVTTAEDVMRRRADDFVARELLRSDSPWNNTIEGELV